VVVNGLRTLAVSGRNARDQTGWFDRSVASNKSYTAMKTGKVSGLVVLPRQSSLDLGGVREVVCCAGLVVRSGSGQNFRGFMVELETLDEFRYSKP